MQLHYLAAQRQAEADAALRAGCLLYTSVGIALYYPVPFYHEVGIAFERVIDAAPELINGRDGILKCYRRTLNLSLIHI